MPESFYKTRLLEVLWGLYYEVKTVVDDEKDNM